MSKPVVTTVHVLRAIAGGARTLSGIAMTLSALGANAGRWDRPTDRALQKARRAGLVTYTRAAGWSLTVKGGEAHLDATDAERARERGLWLERGAR